tara:strand:- start:2149 stop:2691 length:543 start_codon:yes stop_codon:yes gene_type:complete
MGMSTIIDGSASVTINNGAILGITSGTAVASTSGTSIEFTSIPTWVKRITVQFIGVSTNGTGNIRTQIGSGSFTTSGYLGSNGFFTTTATTEAATTGFTIQNVAGAGQILHATTTITLVDASTYTWVATSVGAASQAAQMIFGAGSISLSGTLDRLRIIGSTTGSPADTFDAGKINILYE